MTTLTIKLHDDGNVELTGPVENKVLCYGMLECAKDIIHDYNAAKAAQKSDIARPSPADLRVLTGGRRHS